MAALFRRLESSRVVATAQVAGAVWGQQPARVLASVPPDGASVAWKTFRTTGRLPPAWLDAAIDAVRHAGLDAAVDAMPAFVRAAVYSAVKLGTEVAEGLPERGGNKEDSPADAIARL